MTFECRSQKSFILLHFSTSKLINAKEDDKEKAVMEREECDVTVDQELKERSTAVV